VCDGIRARSLSNGRRTGNAAIALGQLPLLTAADTCHMFGQKGAHVTPPEDQDNQASPMNEEMNKPAAIFKIER